MAPSTVSVQHEAEELARKTKAKEMAKNTIIDNTDWDVGCYESFTTFDDDFMSTDPTTPLGTTAADLTGGLLLPHPLEIGADDVLYMGSGRYLHGYDGGGSGSNGNFLSQLLTLPAGFIITFTEKFF